MGQCARCSTPNLRNLKNYLNIIAYPSCDDEIPSLATIMQTKVFLNSSQMFRPQVPTASQPALAASQPASQPAVNAPIMQLITLSCLMRLMSRLGRRYYDCDGFVVGKSVVIPLFAVLELYAKDGVASISEAELTAALCCCS